MFFRYYRKLLCNKEGRKTIGLPSFTQLSIRYRLAWDGDLLAVIDKTVIDRIYRFIRLAADLSLWDGILV